MVRIVIRIARPSGMVLINTISKVVGMEQCFLFGHLENSLLLASKNIVEIVGILGIGEAFVLEDLAIPNRMEVGVLTKPFHLDCVATFVVEMGKVHWAEAVCEQVHVENERIVVIRLARKYRF